MACIVKIPQNMSKGVLVVTDGEYRDWLVANPAMRARFERLRGRWLIAVHANSAIQQRMIANPRTKFPANPPSRYKTSMPSSKGNNRAMSLAFRNWISKFPSESKRLAGIWNS